MRPLDWGDEDSRIAAELWERKQAENHPELYPEATERLPVAVREPEPRQEYETPDIWERYCAGCGKLRTRCKSPGNAHLGEDFL